MPSILGVLYAMHASYKSLGVHPRIVDITPAHEARSIEAKDPDIYG